MARLETVRSLSLYPRSRAEVEGAEFGLSQTATGQELVLFTRRQDLLQRFRGICSMLAEGQLLVGPTSPENAAALRESLPWLNPRPLGLKTSAGMGDRLGIATPGHIRALRAAEKSARSVDPHPIAPILAQQSIREMTRTGRTPQQVMDDATWGIFQEGWQDGVGADADHLKTPADIDACLAAGFTFYTVDPGEHVDNRAETASPAELQSLAEGLPWDRLHDTLRGLATRYLNLAFDLEGHTIRFDQISLLRAAVKYGRAIAHVTQMYEHLLGRTGGKNVELEVSVDETELPTTHVEHVYLASELQRLGVKWVSLAPRYIGRFEKGVDYIGDVAAFDSDLAVHAAIARKFGPYKLSLHSGSDKFSVYAPAVRQTRGLVHLKTAGTSYLEALHTIAELDPPFFRSIYIWARSRYETDKASYHVSARLDHAPLPDEFSDSELPKLLDQFDAREILHVTFGSVLREQEPGGRFRFYDHLMALLRANPEAYAKNLEAHFLRHLAPFAEQAKQ